jgi:hypothetical protein
VICVLGTSITKNESAKFHTWLSAPFLQPELRTLPLSGILANVYKAPTVATPATIITSVLRFVGQVHTPPQADLASVMNLPRPFFPMTSCQVYKSGLEFPPASDQKHSHSEFLIVPKNDVLWIAEPESDDLEVRRSYRNLYFLYDTYLIKGEVNIPSNVRLSDFLSRAVAERPFQYVYRAQVRLPKPDLPLTESSVVVQLEVALINLRKVLGFYDISEDNTKPDLSGF